MTGHGFLTNLAIVLCVAAVTTVVFQWLRQPVVLGYLIAGLIIGPHVPVPLVADAEAVHQMSELGVTLLMFSLGLEFSLRKLIKVGRRSGIIAVIETSVMAWLGYLAGRLLGFGGLESVFCGGMLAISSTTIVTRTFDEHKVAGELREIVFGILIVEDLIAILLMATLTAIAKGSGLSPTELMSVAGKLAAFLIGVLVVGLLLVPPTISAIMKLGRNETTLVATLGICFACALLADELGYSVALGAFLAGSLVCESGRAEEIEHLVHPIRDVFAAVFFVAVGMTIEPRMLVDHAGAIGLLTGVVLVGKLFAVPLGTFLTGAGVRRSIQAGLSLAQIGEFSFIIAGLGVSLGAAPPSLYAIAVAVSALTTLLTPFLVRGSQRIAHWIDAKLPRNLQTFAALYGSWLSDVRAKRTRLGLGARRLRRSSALLIVDAVVLCALFIAAGVWHPEVIAWAGARLRVNERVALAGVIAGVVVMGAPFLIGSFRSARQVGLLLAAQVLPHTGPEGQAVDLGNAPRRALVVTLQLAALLVVLTPLTALSTPFVGVGPGLAIYAAIALICGVAFWRRAADLYGHVRAGAEVVIEVVLSQTKRPPATGSHAALTTPEPAPEPRPAVLTTLLAGLGDPVTVTVGPESSVVGKTLAEIDLRGVTGATVLAIGREGGSVVAPSGGERLLAGDRLSLIGAREAIEQAGVLIAGTPAA